MEAEPPRVFLLDTNVISNRGAATTDPSLAEWLQVNGGSSRLSVVTMAEMRRGLFLLEARVARMGDRKARSREERRLRWKQAWYREVTERFVNRIIPIDLPIAERWAEMSSRFPSLRDADKAIAATALVRGFGVATENTGDFRRTGVVLVNPFDRKTWGDDAAWPMRD